MSCEGCMYWSEMVAACDGGGPVKALCMHESTRGWSYDNRMTYQGCAEKEPGIPLDMPAWRRADE